MAFVIIQPYFVRAGRGVDAEVAGEAFRAVQVLEGVSYIGGFAGEQICAQQRAAVNG